MRVLYNNLVILNGASKMTMFCICQIKMCRTISSKISEGTISSVINNTEINVCVSHLGEI